MKKSYYYLAVFGIIAIITAILVNNYFSRQGEDTDYRVIGNQVSAVKGNNEFAFDLYRKLTYNSSKSNLFFSPFSIYTGMGMIYAGASGKSTGEMARVFHFSKKQNTFHSEMQSLLANLQSTTENKVRLLEPANQIWLRKDLQPAPGYEKVLKEKYSGEFKWLDFSGNPREAENAINAWVKEKTHGKIQEISLSESEISQLDLILTNIIHFKGNWQVPFSHQLTKTGNFTTLTGSKVPIPFMHTREPMALFSETSDYKMLSLPCIYAEKFYPAVIFILPQKNDGLVSLENKFDAEELYEAIRKMEHRDVTIAIPKFSFTSDIPLVDTLKGMGLTEIFKPGGLPGISKDRKLDTIFHKTSVTVNEEGIEAAALTELGMMNCKSDERKEFIADHPFMFVVFDMDSQCILFIGRVTDPSQ